MPLSNSTRRALRRVKREEEDEALRNVPAWKDDRQEKEDTMRNRRPWAKGRGRWEDKI